MSTAQKILKDGFYDVGDELEIALKLDQIAEYSNAADAVILRDAAIDIRHLVRLVQDFSKIRKNKKAANPFFYKVDDVATMLNLSKSSIYRMVGLNELPSIVKLSDRASGFVAKEIDDWIVKKISREA